MPFWPIELNLSSSEDHFAMPHTVERTLHRSDDSHYVVPFLRGRSEPVQSPEKV